ncbi:MAG: hypothetical protein NTW20_03625 [Rhodobacterales bacterium]|nr:hypothetical protein [Rhodobacterales bacterium]
MQDSDLDGLLGLAARARPTPSTDLMDRVLADALALQPGAAPPWRATAMARQGERPGWLARLAAAFGGAPVLAGVCASMVVGLAVGYLNPSALDYLTSGLTGAETGTLELFPTTDFLATEG